MYRSLESYIIFLISVLKIYWFHDFNKNNKTTKQKKHNNLMPKLSSRRFFLCISMQILFSMAKFVGNTDTWQIWISCVTCSKLQNSFHGRWVCFYKDILGSTAFQQSKWARIMHANEMHVTSCIFRHSEGGAICFSGRSTTWNNFSWSSKN